MVPAQPWAKRKSLSCPSVLHVDAQVGVDIAFAIARRIEYLNGERNTVPIQLVEIAIYSGPYVLQVAETILNSDFECVRARNIRKRCPNDLRHGRSLIG